MKLIIRANSARDKVPFLYEVREKLEELEFLIRISKEVHAVKIFQSFQYAIEGVVSVSKQN